MQSIIRTQSLIRRFQSGFEQVVALNNINCNISNNKLTIFRGPSGSGKTTLINLLGALDYPTSGDIWIADNCISKINDEARDKLRRTDISFIFQSIALMGHMTAQENVEFRLRLAGFKYDECKKRSRECLEMVGLKDKTAHLPFELSGGEQQRVAIARAISCNPKVIFADEPTAQLDTAMSLHIIKIFKELIEQQNIAIIMTTHDPDMIEIADEVFTLQDGEIVDTATAKR